MRSKAAIGGHPLHPMLVGVPIGLFVWTLIADVVYLATDRDRTWYDIAFWTGIAAWVSALVAALPGLIDLVSVAIKSNARNLALAHAGLNVSIVALFAVATALMWDHGALTGFNWTLTFILHILGVGFLGLSGWLGGELVYRHHISILADTGALEAEETERHSRGARGMRPGRV